MVVGLVDGDALPQPLPVELGVLAQLGGAAVPAEDLPVPEEEKLLELGRIQKDLDDPVALVGVGGSQELADPVGRRQGPGQVQADPPQKLGIAGELRGNDVEFLQLGEDVPVDEVVFRRLGIAGNRIGDHAETDGGSPPRRSNQNAGLAGLVGLDQAPFVDVHHRPVDGLVDDLPGDILPPAVAEVGRDQNLLLALQVHHAFPGIDLQALDLDVLRLTFLSVRSAQLNPLEDPGVLGGVGAESEPAPVGYLESGLLQNQALLRILQIHPWMGRFLHFGREDLELPALHDPLVVVAGIGGVGGELETALSGNGAVAGGVVATLLGQQRPDIAGKAEGTLLLGPSNGDGAGGFPTRHPGREHQVAVRKRLDAAVGGEPDQSGLGPGKLGLGGEVALQAVREGSHHQELLRGIGPLQPDLGGRQAE